MKETTQEQPKTEQTTNNMTPYRLTISTKNKYWILDLARYFDERPTVILNEIINHNRIETPQTLIEHMRQRFLTRLEPETSIQSFRDAIENKTAEAAETIQDNIKDMATTAKANIKNAAKKAKPKTPRKPKDTGTISI